MNETIDWSGPAEQVTCKHHCWCGNKALDRTPRTNPDGHIVDTFGIWRCSRACADKHAKNLPLDGTATRQPTLPAVPSVAITCKHGSVGCAGLWYGVAKCCAQCIDDRCRAFDPRNPDVRCSPECYGARRHVEQVAKAKSEWKKGRDGDGNYDRPNLSGLFKWENHITETRADAEIRRSVERVRRFR